MAKAAVVKSVTVKEAAKLAGIGDKGFRRYIRNGKVKASKVDGNWLVALNDVEAFIKFLAEKPAKGSEGKVDTLVCPICESITHEIPDNEFGSVVNCGVCEGAFIFRSKHIEKREPVVVEEVEEAVEVEAGA